MASRSSLTQSRAGYIGTSTNAKPADGDFIVTGNVGIGTTSPSEKLEVDGNVQIGSSTDAKLYMVSTGGNGNNERFFIEGYADGGTYGGGFKLSTRNDVNVFNTAVTVNRYGNVGIGDTSPADKLTVLGNGRFGTGSNGNQHIKIMYGSGASDYGAIRFHQAGYNNNTIHAFSTAWQGNNPLVSGGSLNIEGATATTIGPWYDPDAVIRNGGSTYFKNNVGIGTTSPESKLHVFAGESNGGASNSQSTLTLENNDNTYLQFLTPTNRESGILFGDNDNDRGALTYSHSTDSMNFRVAASTKMFITSTGNVGIGTTSPGRKLDVSGITKTVGFQNTNNYVEGFLSASFSNGVANQNYDIQLGNISFWGYIEVEITGTYSNQNTAGKLTKIYAVGTNPAVGGNSGIIYTNDTRVSDSIGTIKDNIALGDLRFDGTDDTGVFAIRVSHIVSTGNSYTIKVRVFTHGSDGSNGAAGILNNLTLSSVYTQAALTRQYVYYPSNVGIGTTSPNYKLDVEGDISLVSSGENYAILSPVSQGMNISVGDPADKASPLMNLGGGGTQHVGIGTTSPGAKLEVVGTIRSNTNGNRVTGNINLGLTTNNATKWSSITSTQYAHDTETEGFSIVNGLSTSALNAVYIGGALNEQNAATEIGFFTAANTTTRTGGVKMKIISNGNVGIGTTLPGARLEVFGTGNSFRLDSGANGSKEILFRNVGTGTATIKTDGDLKLYTEDAGKNILFDTTGGEKMRITSSGNVGIGTTNPAVKLQIYGNPMPATGDAASVEDILTLYRNGSQTVWSGGATLALGRYSTGGSSQPKSRLDFKLKNATGSNTALPEVTVMTMQSNGNVGIGTTSPVTQLEIGAATNVAPKLRLTLNDSGDSIGAGQEYGGIQWKGNDGQGDGVRADIRVFGEGASGETYMTFGTMLAGTSASTNAQERMRITSAGNVGIGTTSPLYKLDVSSGNSSNAFGLSLSGTARLKMYADGTYNYYTAQSGQSHRFTTTGGAEFLISNGGNVGIGTTNPDSDLHVAGDIRWEGISGVEGVLSGSEVDLTISSIGSAPIVMDAAGTNALRLDPDEYMYKIGDYDGDNNGTYLEIDDDGQLSTFYNSDLDVRGGIQADDNIYAGRDLQAAERVTVDGVKEYRESFTANGNSTLTFDVDIKSIGASGQPFEVFAGWTHYSTSYGCMFKAAYYQRSTAQSNITLVQTLINQSSLNGGFWSVSYVDANTIRITKNAGSHTSSGHGYIRVTHL